MGSVKGRKGERKEMTSRQNDQSARESLGHYPMGDARGGVGACPGVFGFVLLGGGRDGGEESLVLVFGFFPPRWCFFGGAGGGGGDAFRSFFAFCFPGFVFPGRAEPPPALRRTGAQRTTAAPRR